MEKTTGLVPKLDDGRMQENEQLEPVLIISSRGYQGN